MDIRETGSFIKLSHYAEKLSLFLVVMKKQQSFWSVKTRRHIFHIMSSVSYATKFYVTHDDVLY